jgi:hypothetical protein
MHSVGFAHSLTFVFSLLCFYLGTLKIQKLRNPISGVWFSDNLFGDSSRGNSANLKVGPYCSSMRPVGFAPPTCPLGTGWPQRPGASPRPASSPHAEKPFSLTRGLFLGPISRRALRPGGGASRRPAESSEAGTCGGVNGDLKLETNFRDEV